MEDGKAQSKTSSHPGRRGKAAITTPLWIHFGFSKHSTEQNDAQWKYCIDRYCKRDQFCFNILNTTMSKNTQKAFQGKAKHIVNLLTVHHMLKLFLVSRNCKDRLYLSYFLTFWSNKSSVLQLSSGLNATVPPLHSKLQLHFSLGSYHFSFWDGEYPLSNTKAYTVDKIVTIWQTRREVIFKRFYEEMRNGPMNYDKNNPYVHNLALYFTDLKTIHLLSLSM